MKKILILYITFFFLNVLHAQDSYRKYITRISQERIPQNCISVIKSGDTVQCSIDEHPLKFYRQEKQDTTAFIVALQIFPPNRYNIIDPLIREFIERELFLYLIMSPAEWQKHKKILQINTQYLTKNKVALLSKQLTGININFLDGKYTVGLKNEQIKNPVTFIFPSTMETLSVLDRPKNQQKLFEDLKNFKPKKIPFITPENIVYDSIHKYYVSKGGSFILKEIKGDTYYTGKEGNLLFHSGFPEESVSNLFLTNLSENYTLQAELEMPVYGEMYKFSMPLAGLLSYFNEDFQKFFGVESLKDGKLKAILVLANKKYAYIHLMQITQDFNNLFGEKDKKVKIKLYTYIPLHNLGTLFAEFKKS